MVEVLDEKLGSEGEVSVDVVGGMLKISLKYTGAQASGDVSLSLDLLALGEKEFSSNPTLAAVWSLVKGVLSK